MDKYTSAKEAVNKPVVVLKNFLDAINAGDFAKAREFSTNDMQFKGVLGSVNGADEYFAQMEKMQLKYAVHKMFSADQDVAVFYEITMGNEKVDAAGWYTFKNDKVHLIQVIFDPRKVL